jgi:hypothetical protein
VRYTHFGEGEYDRMERAIRSLLAVRLPAATAVPDRTPRGLQTPETYLGWERLPPTYAGSRIVEGRAAVYRFPPTLPPDSFAYAGRWQVEPERIVAGPGARLRFHFVARLVHLVLSGRGSVDVLLDGRRARRIRVDENRLYTLADLGRTAEGELELRLSPGLAAYAFTFGSERPAGEEPVKRRNTGLRPTGASPS